VNTAHQVLVVEDDVDIREGLMDFLEDHGYHAIGAVHGQEALQKLSEPDFHPRMIILDLMMPVMDGRTFRERQLEYPRLAAIPVVVISASREAEQTARELNMAGHFPKPLNLDGLLQAVRKHCSPD
jgi:CheY-like chemotaxis protein